MRLNARLTTFLAAHISRVRYENMKDQDDSLHDNDTATDPRLLFRMCGYYY